MTLDTLITLMGFAFITAFYPATIRHAYIHRQVKGLSEASLTNLAIGCLLLTITAWYGAAYLPFVIGNAINCGLATWLLILRKWWS